MQTAHKEKKGDSSFLLFSSAVSDDTRGCEKKSFVSVKKERKYPQPCPGCSEAG
jgi:hypothetical protein